MKMNFLKKIVIVIMMNSLFLLHAADHRNRTHSVNKAIQTIGKIKEKKLSIVEQLHNVVKDGKVVGQLRMLYSDLNNNNRPNTYATAIGGMLKYETAQYKGLSTAVALVTTNDIRSLSGEGEALNEELSGLKRSYTQLSEAYVNYKYKYLSLRAGRQKIDTPLADSDDIRMIANSFEAYRISYAHKGFSFTLGDLVRWQGIDAGLDNGWVQTGEKGVQYGALTYSNKIVDISLWVYNFSNPSQEMLAAGSDAVANVSIYSDISGHFNLKKHLFMHLNAQFLSQTEKENSGVAAQIYGVMGEMVYRKFAFRLAYNYAAKKENKQSFSGYGGGTLYTSMDKMILDEITAQRKSDAVMAALSYHHKHLHFLYAYGDFRGDEDSSGIKAHIIEQNIAMKYKYNKAVTIGAIYVIDTNKQEPYSTLMNEKNARMLFAYNF
ncbi:hypothetical protein [Sulfurimonas sp.]